MGALGKWMSKYGNHAKDMLGKGGEMLGKGAGMAKKLHAGAMEADPFTYGMTAGTGSALAADALAGDDEESFGEQLGHLGDSAEGGIQELLKKLGLA